MTERSGVRAGPAKYRQLCDRDLLWQFTQDRDEMAFRVLVERHGALVFRVCRAVLRRHHDAEDAFQATFLVLAKKADSVTWQKSIANWLYSTALRISLKHGRRLQRHHGEPMAEELSSVEGFNRIAIDDAERVLHEELNGLKEQHRTPLVLCYLQGMSYSDAAQSLGLTVTALSGRLQRARHKLRVRLLRRGIGLVLPAAAATGAMSTNPVGASTSFSSTSTAIPEHLLDETIRASTASLSGGSLDGLVRPETLRLIQGETAMFSSSLFVKQMLAGATAVALLAATCLLLSSRVSAQTPLEMTILEAQIPSEHVEAHRLAAAITNPPTGDEAHQEESSVYSISTRSMRVVGSREANIVSIFSAHTGRWHKQQYEPLLGEDVEPLIGGGDVVALKAGDRVYGFSGRTGVWDSFGIQTTADVGPVRVYDDWAEVEVNGVWWAFSAVAPEPKWVRGDLAPVD